MCEAKLLPRETIYFRTGERMTVNKQVNVYVTRKVKQSNSSRLCLGDQDPVEESVGLKRYLQRVSGRKNKKPMVLSWPMLGVTEQQLAGQWKPNWRPP